MVQRDVFIASLGVLALGVTHCTFKADPPPSYRCSAELPECPAGYLCRDTRCVAVGQVGDGGTTDQALDGAIADSLPADSSLDSLGSGDGPTDGAGDLAGDGQPGDATADLSCTIGDSRSCYTGPANTEGVGQCRAGIQRCETGIWGACSDQLTPKVEICDNQDNDCDGQIDQGLQQACYTGPSATAGVGLCLAGRQTCTQGIWGACSGEVTPAEEICDNKDNDCDGAADETLERVCYEGPAGSAGVGLCLDGSQTCSQGSWSTCQGQVLPAAEICDGKDNNCDAKIDETCSCSPGASQTCGSDEGECQAGTQRCLNSGQWGPCEGEITPASESCDNKDNNCNGQVDEGLTKECYSGPAGTQDIGICLAGSQTCSQGVWSSCQGQVLPAKEICDGKDNDCDGAADENLLQSCYSGPYGTSGVGLCRSGTQSCSNGAWNACLGEVTPQIEVCDNKDNDCDGKTDEELTRACYSGPDGTLGVGICKSGLQTCSLGLWGSCVGEVTPQTEICDGKDNDCNAKIDEGFAVKVWYIDVDEDKYGDPLNYTKSCYQPKGYADNDKDCDDRDPNVFTGQPAYFDYPRKNGSYNYNCDTEETLEVDQQGKCLASKLLCEVAQKGWCTAKVPNCGDPGLMLESCRLDLVTGSCSPVCSKLPVNQACH